MSVELKIKAKNLADEARTIKNEEHKLKGYARGCAAQQKHDEANKARRKLNSLTMHRKRDVRNEARATHLARAYLAGQPYKIVENKTTNCRRDYLDKRIVAMINKYGTEKIETHDLYQWYTV